MKERMKNKTYYIILGLTCIIAGLIVTIIVLNVKSNHKTTKNIFEVHAEANDNFVFLGDSITDFYPLEEYFDELPVINSGISGNQTVDLLRDLKRRVYQYNPTKVFILIGTNDLNVERSNKDIVTNTKKIVTEIGKHRPVAKVYIESIYPINNSEENSKIDLGMVGKRKNKDIQYINKEMKKYCDETKKCTYVNIYDQLTDKDGNLATKYTTDGLHISNLGYIKVTKKILEYLH